MSTSESCIFFCTACDQTTTSTSVYFKQKFSSLYDPTKTLYFADCSRFGSGVTYPNTTRVFDSSTWPFSTAAVETNGVSYRHGKLANVLMADGHVASANPKELGSYYGPVTAFSHGSSSKAYYISKITHFFDPNKPDAYQAVADQ